MKVERVSNLTKEIFIEEYLKTHRPVIITDGMKDWDLEKFAPAYLEKEFGHHVVQVYNDLFDLQTIDTLKVYLDRNFGKSDDEIVVRQYTRWYTKLKDYDFFWADDVFHALKDAWSHPYFLPDTSLAIPYRNDNGSININEARYPYKGLFISGRGARTRLHKDPFNSNAILCQFYGTKKFYLYSPDQEDLVMLDKEFVDIKNPDLSKFPHFGKAKMDYEDTLAPGEIILFPAGWFHDVTCESDSISITWNFVHSLELDGLFEHLIKHPNDQHFETLQFFVKDCLKEHASGEEIISFFKRAFQQPA